MPKHTVFTFVCDGVYVPYVTVHGWPEIDAGTSVTALLREAGDWKTLVGWVNERTHEVAAPDFKGALLGCVFAAVFTALFFWFLRHLSIGEGLIMAALPVAVLVVSVRQYRQRKREAEALRQLAASMRNP